MTATQTSPAAPPAPSRRSARSGAAPAAWPRVTAAIHAQGSATRVVVARQDSPEATPSVVEAVSLPPTDIAAISSLLHRHKATLAVHLIASANTVVRCTPVPAGLGDDRQQAAATLALLAESEMPSSIPAHRRAAGIIHPGPDSTPDAVLAVGWPERAPTPVAELPVKDQTWTPELVALAALSRALGGVELALYADRLAGSIALVAVSKPHHSNNGGMNGTPAGAPKTVARVLRGDTSSDSAWHASLQRAVAETSASLSLPPAPVDAPDAPASLVLLGSPMRRPRGVPADPNWLTSFGLAYGAVCALADADPASRPLALLRTVAPREDTNALVRAVEYLASPRRAAIALVACLAVLLFLPLVVAKARETILAARAAPQTGVAGSKSLDDRLKEAERRVAFYTQLRSKRWPMTKLIADISAAAPVGVHVDTISISREQGVTIHGRAKEPGQVTDFRAGLASSLVFGSVNTPNIETEGDAITFQLEAQVVAPLFTPRRDDKADFVKTPLAVRLWGDRAREYVPTDAESTAAAPSDDHPRASRSTEPDSPSRSSRASRGSVRDSGTPHEESSGGTRRAASGASAIPAPLSDAEIAKLDHKTAMTEWTGRKKAAGTPDIDPAIKQRLLDEAEKCKTRMLETK
jgi:hypothetical protein